MSQNIPQMINISNTLPANAIQQVRADILIWQNNINTNTQPLSLADFQKISQYLVALTNTQQQFISDNAALNDPNNAMITEADRNLYNGLLSMYKDYIIQLEQLRVAFNYQQQATQQSLQVQLPQDSNASTQYTQIQQQEQPNFISIAQDAVTNVQQPQQSHQLAVSGVPKPPASERIITHIIKNLPTELAKVRKEFIDKLVKDSELRKSLKPEIDSNPEEDKLLNGIIRLCTLDVNNKENIVSYLKFLKLLGYPKELLKEKLPSSLTKPKAKPKPKVSQTSTSVSKSIKDLSASSTSSNNSPSSGTPVVTKPKQPRKKVVKPDVYIADPNSKKSLNKAEASTVTPSSSSSSSSSSTPVITVPTSEKADDSIDGANKKKISFSKYLKKEDSELETEDPSPNKRSNDEVENDTTENDSSKKQKTSSSSSETSEFSESTTITDNTTPTTPGLTSILKSSTNASKKKKSFKIKFVEENNLVRVYGDDLPTDGLKVTPTELKKVLRPFVEGEPNEKLYLETVNTSLSGRSTYVLPLNLDNIKNDIIDNDIVETRGGPVKCMTAVPLLYKTEFNNFNKDLKKKLPREPIITNDDIETLNNPENKKPIIAKAFGKNKLLLRSDRGGMSYKPVPEVSRNYYPIKYTSE